MPKKNTCLLIGLGQIGMGYDLSKPDKQTIRTHSKAISLSSSFSLLGAVEKSKVQMKKFQEKYSLPTYKNIADAMEKSQPEIIIIATPTKTHSKLLNEILNYKCVKAILCEKPLDTNYKLAEKMVADCEKKQVSLYVNYIRRCDPGALEIKRKIEKNIIQMPIKGNCFYSKGFLNNGSHFINLLEFWLGEIKKIVKLNKGRKVLISDSEPDVLLVFKNAQIIMQAVNNEAFTYNSIELLSISGRLRYEDGGNRILWKSIIKKNNLNEIGYLNKKSKLIGPGMQKYQYYVFKELRKAMDGSQSSICTGRQALETLKTMNKILQMPILVNKKTINK